MSGAARARVARPACLGAPDDSPEAARRRTATALGIARSLDAGGCTADDRLRELHALPAAERAALSRWVGVLIGAAVRGFADAAARRAARAAALATLPPAGSA